METGEIKSGKSGRYRHWLIFLNRSFRGAAISLIVLFSPVYIFREMLKLTGEGRVALGAVFFYYLVVYLFKLGANLAAEELSRTWGLKKQMYVGLVFSVLGLLFLYWSQEKIGMLAIAPVFWGLSTGFFWFGSHGLLLKTSAEGTFGRQWGTGDAVGQFFSMLVPFLGGFLISRWDYGVLFVSAIMLIAVSFLMLLPLEEVRTAADTDFKEVCRLFIRHPRPFLAYAATTGTAIVYSYALPLYLFLILRKEISIGGFFSMTAIMVAVVSFLVGRLSDRGKNGSLIRFGSILQTMVWLARSLTSVVGVLFFLDVADQITNRMITIPMGVKSYHKAIEDHSTGRAILFRETAITLGGIVTFALVGGWLWAGGRLAAVFWLAAGLSLLPLLESGRQNK